MRITVPLLLAACLVAPSAAAQEAADAVAEALFRDGRALMTEHRYPEACAKLAESQRLDPHVGTLLNLAACRAFEGRTATAWAAYSEARAQAARAGRVDHETFAAEQLRALEPRLSRVVVVARHPPPGLVLSLDGQSLEAGALGTPLPVDPGSHSLSAAAPGRKPWSIAFEAREASTKSLTVPELGAADVAPSPSVPALADPPPPAPRPSPPVPPAQTSSDPLGVLGWSLAAVGIVGIGAGAAFGGLSFARNADANAACPHLACSPAGLQADSDAKSYATFSTVAFAVGGAAAVGTLVVVLTRPRWAQVSVSARGLQWTGTW